MNRRELPQQISGDSQMDTKKLNGFSLDKGMSVLWGNGVQIVKKGMFNMIKNAILTKFQLMKIFTEVKPTINNRPLTYISDGPNNPDAVTNCFLSGRFDFSTMVQEDHEVAGISKQFWKRRILGYLSTNTKQINHTRTKY